MDGWTNTLSHESHTAPAGWATCVLRAYVRELSLWAASRTRSRNAHERSLFTAPTTETIDHHPRSTSTISDMVANICRAKHTNTIQYCLPTASGAQPFWSMLRYRQVPFVIAALSVSRSPVRILTLPWTCVMLHHADGTSVSNGKRAFHCESIEPLHHVGWYDWFVTFRHAESSWFWKIKITFNIGSFMFFIWY